MTKKDEEILKETKYCKTFRVAVIEDYDLEDDEEEIEDDNYSGGLNRLSSRRFRSLR